MENNGGNQEDDHVYVCCCINYQLWEQQRTTITIATFIVLLDVCRREEDVRSVVVLVRAGPTVAVARLALMPAGHLTLRSTAPSATSALAHVFPEHQIHVVRVCFFLLFYTQVD